MWPEAAYRGRCGSEAIEIPTYLDNGSIGPCPCCCPISEMHPMRPSRPGPRGSVARLLLPLAALLLAACHQSSGLPATFVQVANTSHAAATIESRSSGILGTGLLSSSRSEDVPACSRVSLGLDPGDYELMIVTGAGTKTFALSVSERNEVWIRVKPDGSVEMVPESAVGPGPYCTP